MDLKPTQLRHFINVVEMRSFQKAARRSFRSQPAVSLAIKTLESQLGAALFEDNKRVILTGFGARILPLAQEFLAHHDRLLRAITQAAEGQSGDVSIAANPSVATRWLPEIIREYAIRHPRVNVIAIDDNSAKIHELVATGQVDIGLASMQERTTDIVFAAVADDDFGLVCRRDHPLNKTPGALKWSRLRGAPMIGNMTHRLLKQLPVGAYVASPRIFMSTLTSLLANVEGGVGVTLLPRLATPDKHPHLVFKLLEEPRVQRTIGVLTRRGSTLPPEAEAMRRLIFEKFGGA